MHATRDSTRHRTTQYNINVIKEEDDMTDKKLHKA